MGILKKYVLSLLGFVFFIWLPVAPPPDAQERQEAAFQELVDGLLVRRTYRAEAEGPFDVEIWDLLIGPGKTSEPTPAPAAVVLEVRAGSGVLLLDDERRELEIGTTLAIEEGRRFAFDNSQGSQQLAIRAVIASRRQTREAGSQVVPNTSDLREDREFISPPTLQQPIYACASSVVVKNFIPGAKLEVFADGGLIGSAQSWLSDGQNIDVSLTFVGGETVTARQTFDGIVSAPSNDVPVTAHIEDYPSGLPQPRLAPAPLHQCGRAVGVRDVVPGALTRVFSENPAPGGGFLPAVQVGSVADFPYTFISPAFEKDAHIYAESQLCSDVSPRSDVHTVVVEPDQIPPPSHDPIHENTNIVTLWGPAGNPDALINGATLDVFTDSQPPGSERVGGQPTPGGGQQVFINPAAVVGASFWQTQALCTSSDKSEPDPVIPCENLPPAMIKPPLPGDTQIVVTEFVPGAQILVFADGVEIGHSGPPVVNLSQQLEAGQTVTVLQRLGDCDSGLVQVIDVACANLGGDDRACSGEWPAFRHNGLRNARQTQASLLSDPYAVKKLEVQWSFTPPGARAFRASPIVHDDKVFIGNGNGRLYALDAATGAVLWQYPPSAQPALQTQFASNPSSCGIASSAAIGRIQQEVDAVVFGAPDPTIGAGLGSGRLFALHPDSGTEIWKSPEIAVLDGLTPSAENQLHEQIGYSSPLIMGDRVYIGIANHGDNPIQNGRVAAVDLNNGNILPGFDFKATSTRGGGVWSSPAGGLQRNGVYVTTGNTRCWNGGCQSEPSTNHGLSLLRLDNSNGDVRWKHQPVPFALDGDPDWASGPSLGAASCGELVTSTMKDGWAYAVEASDGTAAPPVVRWQFPPTGFPFTPADGTTHGDSRYLVPGAVWNDVFITMGGGEIVTTDIDWGFNKLHALNICTGNGNRVRWIADVPGTSFGSTYQLGPPTVGHGIVFVGTRQGHLVALADPSVWPAAGSRCSHPNVAVSDCATNGFQVVPEPNVLVDLDIADAPILTEPVLAGDRVFVASGMFCSDQGTLYMLAPAKG